MILDMYCRHPGIINHTLTYGEKMFLKPGCYFEPGVTDMLSLKMIHGSRDGLNEMNSILLAESVAKTYFNNENPIGKVFRIDNASRRKGHRRL